MINTDECSLPTREHMHWTKPSTQARCGKRSMFKQTLTGLNSEFSFSKADCHIKVQEQNLPYLLRDRIVGLITFSFRIWTLVTMFISYKNKHTIFFYIYIYIYLTHTNKHLALRHIPHIRFNWLFITFPCDDHVIHMKLSAMDFKIWMLYVSYQPWNNSTNHKKCICRHICVCVCVCVCVYIYIYIYIYTHTHTSSHADGMDLPSVLINHCSWKVF